MAKLRTAAARKPRKRTPSPEPIKPPAPLPLNIKRPPPYTKDYFAVERHDTRERFPTEYRTKAAAKQKRDELNDACATGTPWVVIDGSAHPKHV